MEDGATGTEDGGMGMDDGPADMADGSAGTEEWASGTEAGAGSTTNEFAAPVSSEPAPVVVSPDPVTSVAAAPIPAAPTPVQAAPATGPGIASGSRVVAMISRGPSPTLTSAFVAVPFVVGLSQGEALSKLQETGLPSQVFNDYHDRLPRGEVMGQLPESGVSVPSGSESVLLVSSGSAAAETVRTALPNIVGLAESDAISRIQAAGLSPQIVREYSLNIPDGIVMAQLPSATSLSEVPKKKSSLIWLWIILAVLVVAAVATGAYLYLNRTGVVPNVVGLSQAEATTAIGSAGFKVGSVGTTQTIKASDVGKVVAQSPAPNGEAKMSVGIDIVVSGGQKLMKVPDVKGKTQAEAEAELKSAGLTASVSKGFSNTVVKGSVISQAPEAGQQVPAETSVGIVVSEGVQDVTVPGVSGQSQSQATSALKALGLGSQVVNNSSQTVPSGQVAAQFPSAGTAVAPGTIVGLVVSSGSTSSSATVSVPNVVGKTASQAQTAIKNLGLKAVAVQQNGTGQPANQVVGQVPDSGTLVAKSSSVLYFVSTGK